jgi:hypothetical protein
MTMFTSEWKWSLLKHDSSTYKYSEVAHYYGIPGDESK